MYESSKQTGMHKHTGFFRKSHYDDSRNLSSENLAEVIPIFSG